jgi:meiotic recombination protein SPO11
VVASEKGVVVGRCSFRDDGDFIDCTKMGVGGKAIPSLVDRITDIQGDAEFILLVEKDAAFIRLSEDRFYNTYPCVIITVSVYGDLSRSYAGDWRFYSNNVSPCRPKANQMWPPVK